MRPIKLEMIAFGPYSRKEIIDFEQLDEQQLFLITGPTGAGKTTVFDGISYALYGETSGTDRPVKSLRSDNAPADLLTEVTLTFELKGKVHQVHRVPNQLKKKVRGEGFTEQKPEATLNLEGKEYPITGKDNVTEAVKALIGLEVDQFRQIMMIPQGEFRKLLMAKSDERTEILKNIFQTTLYGSLQGKFREEKKRLENDLSLGLNRRKQELQKLEVDLDTENGRLIQAMLKEELINITRLSEHVSDLMAEDKTLIEGDKKTLLTTKDQLKKVIGQKTSVQFNNEKIDRYDQFKTTFERLQGQHEEMTGKKVLMTSLQQAKNIVPLETAYHKRRQEKDQLLSSIQKVKKEIINEEKDFNLLKNQLEKVNGQEAIQALDTIQKEGIQVAAYVEQLKKAEGIKEQLTQQEKDIDTFEMNQKSLIVQEKELKHNLDQIEEKILIEETIKAQKEEQERSLGNKEQLVESLKQLVKRQEDHKQSVLDLDELNEIAKGQKKTLTIAHEAYLKVKQSWYMNQAALIAKELKDGLACPVCGGIDHPHPASFNGQQVTEDQLQDAEIKYNKQQEVYYNHLRKVDASQAIVKTQNDDIHRQIELLKAKGAMDDETGAKTQVEKLEEGCVALKTSISQLVNGLKEIQEAKNKKIHLTNRIEEISKSIDNMAQQHQQMKLKHNELQATLTTLLSDIPNELQALNLLEQQLKNLRRRYKEMIDEKNETEKRFKEKSDYCISLNSKRDQLEETFLKTNDLFQKESVAFNRALDEVGFDKIHVYEGYRSQLNQLEHLQETVRIYDQEYHSAKTSFEKQEELIKGLSRVDVSIYEEQVKGLESQEKTIQDRIAGIERRMHHNQRQLALAEEITTSIGEAEECYKVVGHLSDVVNGQNSKKLTFERYILSTYLRDILEVANYRLHRMTNNRYTLNISTSVTDKRSSSGLDLEVFDSYTGVSRSVKTLSGGESFKASLAMALALAEVVQAYAGGIQLDTVFIDEGFGTLDQESLDSAINCLIELQDSGRLVGIISHVQELKERIQTQLIVEMDDAGSQTRFVVG